MMTDIFTSGYEHWS